MDCNFNQNEEDCELFKYLNHSDYKQENVVHEENVIEESEWWLYEDDE